MEDRTSLAKEQGPMVYKAVFLSETFQRGAECLIRYLAEKWNAAADVTALNGIKRR